MIFCHSKHELRMTIFVVTFISQKESYCAIALNFTIVGKLRNILHQIWSSASVEVQYLNKLD